MCHRERACEPRAGGGGISPSQKPFQRSPVQATRVLSTAGIAKNSQKKSQFSCHSSPESAAPLAFPPTQEHSGRGRRNLHFRSHSYVPGTGSGCFFGITAFNLLSLVLGAVLISTLQMRKSRHRKVKVRQL